MVCIHPHRGVQGEAGHQGPERALCLPNPNLQQRVQFVVGGRKRLHVTGYTVSVAAADSVQPQAVERGLPGTMAFVVERSAIGRPSRGLRDGLPLGCARSTHRPEGPPSICQPDGHRRSVGQLRRQVHRLGPHEFKSDHALRTRALLQPQPGGAQARFGLRA